MVLRCILCNVTPSISIPYLDNRSPYRLNCIVISGRAQVGRTNNIKEGTAVKQYVRYMVMTTLVIAVWEVNMFAVKKVCCSGSRSWPSRSTALRIFHLSPRPTTNELNQVCLTDQDLGGTNSSSPKPSWLSYSGVTRAGVRWELCSAVIER